MRTNDMGPILVINPNSNEAVTQGLRRGLAPLERSDGPWIDCVTLAEGPFGIESQRDSDAVVLPLLRLIEAHPEASAYVIACYSDPGIDACRAATTRPVLGIQEAGVATALCRGDLFGVMAIGEASILRHRRYMRRMGVIERLAGERALNMSVDETARGAGTFDRMQEVGDALVADGAETIVLGCAGMARHRAPLQDALGVPVIDPVQAAVAMALGIVAMG